MLVVAHKSNSPLTRKALQELYVDQRLSTIEVAQKLGVSVSGVGQALRRFGFKLRGSAEAARNRHNSDNFPWDAIETEYASGSSCHDLSEKYGCANTTIISGLRRRGVHIRKPGEGRAGKNFPRVEIDVDAAIAMNKSGETLTEIAQKLEVSYATLAYRLKQNGYKARKNLRVSDSKLKNLQYHKRKVASQLEMKCAVCGEDRAVDLCHIAPAKNGHPLVVENTIVLCPNHHRLFDNGNLSDGELEKILPTIKEAADRGFVNSFWGAF